MVKMEADALLPPSLKRKREEIVVPAWASKADVVVRACATRDSIVSFIADAKRKINKENQEYIILKMNALVDIVTKIAAENEILTTKIRDPAEIVRMLVDEVRDLKAVTEPRRTEDPEEDLAKGRQLVADMTKEVVSAVLEDDRVIGALVSKVQAVVMPEVTQRTVEFLDAQIAPRAQEVFWQTQESLRLQRAGEGHPHGTGVSNVALPPAALTLDIANHRGKSKGISVNNEGEPLSRPGEERKMAIKGCPELTPETPKPQRHPGKPARKADPQGSSTAPRTVDRQQEGAASLPKPRPKRGKRSQGSVARVPSPTLEALNPTPMAQETEAEAMDTDEFVLVQSRRKGGGRNKGKAKGKGRQGGPTSYAEIAAKLPRKPKEASALPRPVYVTVQPEASGGMEGIIDRLPQLDIDIDANVVRTTKAGGVLIRTSSQADAEKLVEKFVGGAKATLARKRRPRILMRGVPKSWDGKSIAEAVLTEIRKEIKDLDKVSAELWGEKYFIPLFSLQSKDPLFKSWIVEVDPALRYGLLDLGSMRLRQWHKTSFRDYVDAPMCVKCQEYGHSKTSCEAETHVCRWCAESGHLSKACPNKSAGPSCINCRRANIKDGKHQPGSEKCWVHRRKILALIKRTNYE